MPAGPMAEHLDLTAFRGKSPGEDLEQGGFSRSIGTDDRYSLSLFNTEGNIMQNLTAVIPDGKVRYLNRGRGMIMLWGRR